MAPYKKNGFYLRTEHIEDYGHYPMAIPGLLHALDLIFLAKKFLISGKFNEITNQDDNALQAILAHYKMLSDHVGFEVYPNMDLRRNASCFRTASRRLRNMKKYDQAIEMYEYWIKQSPKAHKAYAGLAMTFKLMGRHEDAKQALQTAVTYASREYYREIYMQELIKLLSQ